MFPRVEERELQLRYNMNASYTLDRVKQAVDKVETYLYENQDKFDDLQMSIDKINESAGRGKVLIGMANTNNSWRPKSERRSPKRTTDWKDIAVVKA